MLANPYRAYRQNQVETASPPQLILMLYNAAIVSVKLAQTGLEEKDIAKTHTNTVKAQDIINELMNSLDIEQGDIAGNLYLLYEYMLFRLVDANLKKERQPLAEVEDMLTELRDTWSKAIQIAL